MVNRDDISYASSPVFMFMFRGMRFDASLINQGVCCIASRQSVSASVFAACIPPGCEHILVIGPSFLVHVLPLLTLPTALVGPAQPVRLLPVTNQLWKCTRTYTAPTPASPWTSTKHWVRFPIVVCDWQWLCS